MHVDEDLAEPAVRVLARAEMDLVAADAGLLGVALSASGKRFAHDETREAREAGSSARTASVSRGCSIASIVASFVIRIGRIGSEAPQASAKRAQGRGLFVREMRALSAIAGALDGRLRLIRDVGDERRRLPGASPILGPRDRDAPLAARQRDIGEPSLFVRVAIGGGDDAVLERRHSPSASRKAAIAIGWPGPRLVKRVLPRRFLSAANATIIKRGADPRESRQFRSGGVSRAAIIAGSGPAPCASAQKECGADWKRGYPNPES